MTATVHISRGALERNLAVLRHRSAPADVILIVKANAYGHGAIDVARIAHGAGIRRFGCLEPEIARSVRDALPDDDTMVLAWQISHGDDLRDLGDRNIDVGIGSLEQLDLLVEVASKSPIRVHLKVDTGLNRNGVPRGEWSDFLSRVIAAEANGSVVIVGVWTHIAESSDEADERARSSFESARAEAETRLGRTLFAHLAASSASFRLADFRFDAVRIGGHAYGIPSFDNITPTEMGLTPVMTLAAPCVAEFDADWGDVFLVDAGYADGIPGYAAGVVDATVGGVRCRVLAVSEDETVLKRPNGAAGATAVLFGDAERGAITVREWGDALGTLGDEIACRVPSTVPRVVVD